MVRLDRIYTGGGDAGLTSLGDGTRVAKHSRRVEACGAVDEANSAIGAARLHSEGGTQTLLAGIQNDLFDLGADLCVPEQPKPRRPALRVSAARVKALEEAIDAFNARLKPLSSFVLPAGSAASCHLHMARALARRAERATVRLNDAEKVNGEALRYLNRLSDLLFVLARAANDDGGNDVLWRPGGQAPAASPAPRKKATS